MIKLRNLVLAGAVSLMSNLPAYAQEEPLFNVEQRNEIEQIVRQYLRDNPEILYEMARELQNTKEDRNKISDHVYYNNQQDLLNSPMSPVLGDINAPITVIEFFDYNCPYCRQMYKTIGYLPIQDDNVKVIYKELPILAESSEVASRAALAAAFQGKYIAMHNELMRYSGRLTDYDISRAAQNIGLDIEKLEKDMTDDRITQEIIRNRALAKTLKKSGTPITIVGQKIFTGTLTKAALQDHINEAKTTHKLETGQNLFELPELPSIEGTQ